MQYQIQVFASMDTRREQKPVFERIVDYDDSLEFPYAKVVDTLKVLFTPRSIVTFNIQ